MGFTETEAKVILFLIAALVVGGAGIFFKNLSGYESPEHIDYSSIDSLFLNSDGRNPAEDSTKLSDKKVDYEPELLDFSKNELLSQKENSDQKLININTADIADLITVPGIGEVTAGRIIELREKRNGFKSLDELLLVKGIGKTRLEKLKKFLIIE